MLLPLALRGAMRNDVEVIGTATMHCLPDSEQYQHRLAAIGQRAENHGFTGLLVGYHHTTLDPWAAAGVLLQQSSRLTPLIALQPYTMAPFTAAKMISSFSSLYNRRLDINIVTGAATEELHQSG